MRDETVCPVCRGPVLSGGRGRRPVYCSRACQARAYRARRNPPVPPVPPGPAPSLPSAPHWAPSALPSAPSAAHSASSALPSPPSAEDGGSSVTGRRRQVVEAVWRIAGSRGLQSVSIREVAAEAGVSARVVQYHFAGKQDLLVTALRVLHADNERRALRRIAALPDPSDPRALLRATLEEFLPLDGERRAGLGVLTAYYARSLTDPAFAAVFLAAESPLEDLIAALIAAAGPSPGVDPGREADLLVAGVTGLGLDLLHRRRTVADVRRTLDYHLGRILAQP